MEDTMNLWEEKSDSDCENNRFIDPNEIRVSITDPAPIVILFGPSGCGKTMSLVRLTRWLQDNHYTVEPDVCFLPSDDDIYRELCNDFENVVHSGKAAPMTSPMLFKVRNRYGEPICQILDPSGDHCFDKVFPFSPFPLYMEQVMHIRNKKIWIFCAETNWEDAVCRDLYAEKIFNMYGRVASSDKVIFVCSKADKSHHLLDNVGKPYVAQFFRTIKDQYPGIFSKYENRNPITKLWRKYIFDFIVFSAGAFYDTQDGNTYYQQGSDSYPANLWKSIMKAVRK